MRRLFSSEIYPFEMANNLIHVIIRIDIGNLKHILRAYPDQKTTVIYINGEKEDFQLTIEQHNLLIAKLKEKSTELAAAYAEDPKKRETLSTTFHFYLDGIQRAG